MNTTRKGKLRADAMSVSAVRLRSSRHSELVSEIGTRIVRGDYAPGDALPTEAELGTMLGVSRNGVREAVKVLASKGLIVSRTKQGISVRPRSDWNMLDPEILRWCVAGGPTKAFWQSVYQVRKIIEPGAAALAALQGSDADVARIEAAYAGMSTAPSDIEAETRADLRFHLSILEASNNDFVRSFANLIETALASTIQAQNTRPGAFERGRPLHGLVLDAIKRRDPEGARRASLDLLDDVYEALDRARRATAVRPRKAAPRATPRSTPASDASKNQ
jgi:DNA-binding FadR family transcriptional regulator